jgi:hypothetical protein
LLPEDEVLKGKISVAAEEAEKRSEPQQEKKVEHGRSYNRTLAEGESLSY